jgi:hypothetical protein
VFWEQLKPHPLKLHAEPLLEPVALGDHDPTPRTHEIMGDGDLETHVLILVHGARSPLTKRSKP